MLARRSITTLQKSNLIKRPTFITSLFSTSTSPQALTTNPTFPKETIKIKGIPTRNEQISYLSKPPEDNEYDVLIVGGGATGAGAAFDAASRGLKVACIERGDFASETSSRSTKLIWAGIRYLATSAASLLKVLMAIIII